MSLDKLYGLKINSEIVINQEDYRNIQSDLDIRVEKFNDFSKKIVEGKDFWIGVDQSSEEFIIYFLNVAKFKVNNSEILVDPETEDIELINSFLMGPIIAVFLFLRGMLVLHGSAVETDSGVIAFLGPSGLGKSTIAMLLSQNKGYKVLADDLVVIDTQKEGSPVLLQGNPQLKLSPTMMKLICDNYTLEYEYSKDVDKHLIKFDDKDSYNNVNIKKIYVLEKDSNLGITNLNPQDALIKLVDNSYCSIVFQNKEKFFNMLQCSELLKKIDMSLLKFEHSMEMIPDLVKILENDIQLENDIKRV